MMIKVYFFSIVLELLLSESYVHALDFLVGCMTKYLILKFDRPVSRLILCIGLNTDRFAIHV